MTSRIARALSAFALLATAVACSGGGETKGDTQTAAAPKAAGGKFTIALIAKSSTNPVFLAARTGAEAAAKEQSAKTGEHLPTWEMRRPWSTVRP